MAYSFFGDLSVRAAPREGDRTICCTEATADATPSLRVDDKLGARGVRLTGRRGGILTGSTFLFSASVKYCASSSESVWLLEAGVQIASKILKRLSSSLVFDRNTRIDSDVSSRFSAFSKYLTTSDVYQLCGGPIEFHFEKRVPKRLCNKLC